MRDLLKEVSTLKESAKDNRDFGDLKAALDDLNKAVKLLKADYDSTEDADYKTKLRQQLADCYGMMGGIYRRLASKKDLEKNLKNAALMYQQGLEYEDEANDSYNLSNSIIIPIILDPINLERKQPEIKKGLERLQAQVEGVRRNQWWAWADLGLFHLLRGEPDLALKAYQQFKKTGARKEDNESTISVLNGLYERLQTAESSQARSVAESIKDAIDFLKKRN